MENNIFLKKLPQTQKNPLTPLPFYDIIAFVAFVASLTAVYSIFSKINTQTLQQFTAYYFPSNYPNSTTYPTTPTYPYPTTTHTLQHQLTHTLQLPIPYNTCYYQLNVNLLPTYNP